MAEKKKLQIERGLHEIVPQIVPTGVPEKWNLHLPNSSHLASFSLAGIFGTEITLA